MHYNLIKNPKTLVLGLLPMFGVFSLNAAESTESVIEVRSPLIQTQKVFGNNIRI